ncbi:MAG: hypothetical protein IKD89_05330, partial [Clostridia bacterium]|nr:hypothetical protein [Clostridia bacterium]
MYGKKSSVKKALALIVALAMVVSMGVIAMADDPVATQIIYYDESNYDNENVVFYYLSQGDVLPAYRTMVPNYPTQFQLTGLTLVSAECGDENFQGDLSDYIGYSIGADQSIIFNLHEGPDGALPPGYYDWYFEPQISGYQVYFTGEDNSGYIRVSADICEDNPIQSGWAVTSCDPVSLELEATEGYISPVTGVVTVSAFDENDYTEVQIYSLDAEYRSGDATDWTREYLSWTTNGNQITFSVAPGLPAGVYYGDIRITDFDCGNYECFDAEYLVTMNVKEDENELYALFDPEDISFVVEEGYTDLLKETITVSAQYYSDDSYAKATYFTGYSVDCVEGESQTVDPMRNITVTDGAAMCNLDVTIDPDLPVGSYVWQITPTVYADQLLCDADIITVYLDVLEPADSNEIVVTYNPEGFYLPLEEGYRYVHPEEIKVSAERDDGIIIPVTVTEIGVEDLSEYEEGEEEDYSSFINCYTDNSGDVIFITVDPGLPVGEYVFGIFPSAEHNGYYMDMPDFSISVDVSEYDDNDIEWVDIIPVGVTVSATEGVESELSAPVRIVAYNSNEAIVDVDWAGAAFFEDLPDGETDYREYLAYVIEGDLIYFKLLPGIPAGEYCWTLEPLLATDRGYSTSEFQVTAIVAERTDPGIITINTIAQRGSAVYLGWNADAAADSYRIYKKPYGGSWTVLASGLTDTYCLDNDVTAGTKYYYKVRGGKNGSYPSLAGETSSSITVEAPEPAITISGQPQNVTTPAGNMATFTVEAYGVNQQNLTYLWRYSGNGTTWADATKFTGYDTDTITVKALESRDGMYVKCVISDAQGNTVESDPAQLFIGQEITGATIVIQPQDVTTTANSMAQFTVAAEGNYLTYKWQYSASGSYWADATKFEGYDTDTITVKALESRDGMYFRCIVYDMDMKPLPSDTAQLHIGQPITGATIVIQPEDVTTTANSMVQFSVAAEGNYLTYKWQYSASGSYWADATKFAGYDTDTITVKALESRDGMYFRCIVYDMDLKPLTSDPAQLHIGTPQSTITITQDPVDVTTTVNNTITYTVAAQGSPNAQLSYKWEYSAHGTFWADATKFAGYDTPTISVKALESRDQMYFRCVVSDNLGNSETSKAARLYIGAPSAAISITGNPEDVTTTANSMASFTVTAESATDQTLSYLWQYSSNGNFWADATKFAGYDTDTITIKALASRDGMYVRCTVSDPYGNTETCDPAQLHIGTPQSAITITQNPVDVTTTANNTITYTVAAQGSPNAQLSYKW